jgi:hypothetical protein
MAKEGQSESENESDFLDDLFTTSDSEAGEQLNDLIEKTEADESTLERALEKTQDTVQETKQHLTTLAEQTKETQKDLEKLAEETKELTEAKEAVKSDIDQLSNLVPETSSELLPRVSEETSIVPSTESVTETALPPSEPSVSSVAEPVETPATEQVSETEQELKHETFGSPRPSAALILIDPQHDMCEIPLSNLMKWLKTNPLQKLYIAEHAKTGGIDTRGFWESTNGSTLGDEVKVKDILDGHCQAVNETYRPFALNYAKRLERLGRIAICFRDENLSRSSQIEQIAAIMKPEIRIYGTNAFTETISIFESIVEIRGDPTTSVNTAWMAELAECDTIYCAGDQLATHYSVRSLTNHLDPSKLTIIEDALCKNACFHGVPSVNIIDSSQLLK